MKPLLDTRLCHSRNEAISQIGIIGGDLIVCVLPAMAAYLWIETNALPTEPPRSRVFNPMRGGSLFGYNSKARSMENAALCFVPESVLDVALGAAGAARWARCGRDW